MANETVNPTNHTTSPFSETVRSARSTRTTRETSITIHYSPDDAREPAIATNVPFFDHMLTAMAFHGRMGLVVEATGDLEVDPHHLVEDTGLVLGDVLREVADLEPTERFGNAVVPMDDACGEATVDLGGRPYLVYRAEYPQPYAGAFDLSLLREFFNAFAIRAKANIHLDARYGLNGHHMAEALFKALGMAIRTAVARREGGGMSTKGLI